MNVSAERDSACIACSRLHAPAKVGQGDEERDGLFGPA